MTLYLFRFFKVLEDTRSQTLATGNPFVLEALQFIGPDSSDV